jgi:ribonuclease M5
MIKLNEAVIVEGKYDKIRLSNILDAVIISVNGFHIFSDSEMIALIRFYAYNTGIIILTDSDSAGFKIRNFIKNSVLNSPENDNKSPRIINVYTPDIFGKERRKSSPSKEGKLGVEGISDEILISLLGGSGIKTQSTKGKNPADLITKTDLFLNGFSGCDNALEKRRELARSLHLPELLSTSSLIDILNTKFTKQEFIDFLKRVTDI